MTQPQLNQSENRLHQECYLAFHNKYPQHRGLLCYNLNNSYNRIQGALNKSKGLQEGRSDLTFYWQGKAYHLELKTDTGAQSPAQKKWQAIIEAAGFQYTLHITVHDLMNRIEGVMAQNPIK